MSQWSEFDERRLLYGDEGSSILVEKPPFEMKLEVSLLWLKDLGAGILCGRNKAR